MSKLGDFWEDYEVLTVETPENIELRLPLAGFGPRFLALLIDNLIQGVGYIVLAFIIFGVGISMGAITEGGSGLMIILLVAVIGSLLVMLGYFVIFEVVWNGQTPGKRITGIRVVRRGGLPLTFRDSLLRNLMRLVDYFPSYALVGMLGFFATKFQQRLGDLVADTVVIREFSRQQPFSYATMTTGSSTSAIKPKLSYAIHSYLLRRGSLAMEVRLPLTARIITNLGFDPTRMSIKERDDYLMSIMHWQASQQ